MLPPCKSQHARWESTSALGEISSAPPNCNSITYEKRLPAPLDGRPTAPYPNAAPVYNNSSALSFGDLEKDIRPIPIIFCHLGPSNRRLARTGPVSPGPGKNFRKNRSEYEPRRAFRSDI
ncbi:hypothetical protein J6590_023560 [Homalodisca vitripennis]|nr:hypothetical protein J6590_023560 [Homalodisca vitripennis]